MAEKKVAIYARGLDLEQIDAQVRACRCYCEAHNFAVAVVNKDLTEKNLIDRFPALREKYRDIGGIVVVAPTRIARDKTQLCSLLHEMHQAGIELYCIDAEEADIPFGYQVDETGRLIIAQDIQAFQVTMQKAQGYIQTFVLRNS
jgi:DNA invertase Pin-like site-specific DNA recombinase